MALLQINLLPPSHNFTPPPFCVPPPQFCVPPPQFWCPPGQINISPPTPKLSPGTNQYIHPHPKIIPRDKKLGLPPKMNSPPPSIYELILNECPIPKIDPPPPGQKITPPKSKNHPPPKMNSPQLATKVIHPNLRLVCSNFFGYGRFCAA